MSGMTTVLPAIGTPSVDGMLHCKGHGVSSTAFAGICIYNLLDEIGNVSDVNASLLLPLAPYVPLHDNQLSQLVAIIVISTCTILNVLTVRWARQARQKRIPISERDPLWTPIAVNWLVHMLSTAREITKGAICWTGTRAVRWLWAFSSISAFIEIQASRRSGAALVVVVGKCWLYARLIAGAIFIGISACTGLLRRTMTSGAKKLLLLLQVLQVAHLASKVATSAVCAALRSAGRTVLLLARRLRVWIITSSASLRIMQLIMVGCAHRILKDSWRRLTTFRVPMIELPPTVKLAIFAATGLAKRIRTEFVDALRRSTALILLGHVASRLGAFAFVRLLRRVRDTICSASGEALTYIADRDDLDGRPTVRLAVFVVTGRIDRAITASTSALLAAFRYTRAAIHSSRGSGFIVWQCTARQLAAMMQATRDAMTSCQLCLLSCRVTIPVLSGCLFRMTTRLNDLAGRIANIGRQSLVCSNLSYYVVWKLCGLVASRGIALARMAAQGLRITFWATILLPFTTSAMLRRTARRVTDVVKRAATASTFAASSLFLARFTAFGMSLRLMSRAATSSRHAYMWIQGGALLVLIPVMVVKASVLRSCARVLLVAQSTSTYIWFAWALRKITIFLVSSWFYRSLVVPFTRCARPSFLTQHHLHPGSLRSLPIF